MTRNRSLRRLASVAVPLTALVLGACSDSDSDTTTGSGAGSSSTDAMGKDDATDDAPAAEAEAEAGDAVAIEDFNFKPASLKVKVGTKVTFTNKDSFAHTATAKDKSFDTGNLDKDAAAEITFDKAGTFDYICTIHNSMTGSVTVS